jgi:hypothetical protein
MSDLALVVGGAISCLGLGWAVGRWIKTLRQFFDSVS